MTSSLVLTGFPPLVSTGARVLILGNMPSVISLAEQQYYGNPRNAFWPIMGELFGFEAAAPYGERVRVLTARGVAIWDVLRSCRRAGSLDSAVERDSMVANDFARLFVQNPTIDRVYFNGAAAEANYRRLVTADIPARYTRLPSTSPAHTMAFAAKLAAWREVLDATNTGPTSVRKPRESRGVSAGDTLGRGS